MIQLQNAFCHLLPILDDPDYIPLANSTPVDDPVAPMHSSCSQWHEETPTIVLSSDKIAAATDKSLQNLSDNNAVLSALNFYSGRKCGQMCSYNCYCYALNKLRPDGYRYWDCEDRWQHNPSCEGRLITVRSDTVTKGSAGPIVTPPHITDN